MNRSQRAIITLLSIVACVLLGFVGYYGAQAYQFYSAIPLGPGLSTYSPFMLPATWTPRPATPGTPLGYVTYVPTISFATERPQTLCNGPYVMNILAIGSDARADTYKYGLGDVIRILRVDFATPRVTVLEFPRDLWVQIPFIADNLNGQDHEKLNQAYLYGNPGDAFHYWDDPSGGSGLTALTLELNFGVKVDHYIAVNMRTFEKVVDAVGGIEVTVTDADMANSTDLAIGHHYLNGPEALKVARKDHQPTGRDTTPRPDRVVSG
jgi:LCP family protein required for cell wall assembly